MLSQQQRLQGRIEDRSPAAPPSPPAHRSGERVDHPYPPAHLDDDDPRRGAGELAAHQHHAERDEVGDLGTGSADASRTSGIDDPVKTSHVGANQRQRDQDRRRRGGGRERAAARFVRPRSSAAAAAVAPSAGRSVAGRWPERPLPSSQRRRHVRALAPCRDAGAGPCCGLDDGRLGREWVAPPRRRRRRWT